MALDPQTERRLRELFAGQHCCLCDRPAARLAANLFYCERHFLRGKRGPTARPCATAARHSNRQPSSPLVCPEK